MSDKDAGILPALLGSLKDLNRRSHSDMFAMTNVAAQANLAQESRHNIHRAQSHADALLKQNYDCYEPPEREDGDDVGTNIVSGNVIVTEDSLAALINQAGKSGGGGDDQTGTPSDAGSDKPQPESQPQPKKTPLWKKALGVTAIAALPVAGGLVANYLNDSEDTNSVENYSIEAVPFDPNQ